LWITLSQNRVINQRIVLASAKNICVETQLCLAHHYLGHIAPNLNKPAGRLILTKVKMELQDVSGPIQDLTMDHLRFHSGDKKRLFFICADTELFCGFKSFSTLMAYSFKIGCQGATPVALRASFVAPCSFNTM
jgi:hypothetical protein